MSKHMDLLDYTPEIQPDGSVKGTSVGLDPESGRPIQLIVTVEPGDFQIEDS